MENAAMWLASIFGPLLVIIGLWKLLYIDSFKTRLHLYIIIHKVDQEE